MTLLLYITYPLLCILAIPPTSRRGAFAERLVFGIALYEFLLFATGTTLGLTHHLTTQTYAAVTWCAALVLLILAWRNGISLDLATAFRWFRTRRGAAAFLPAALIALAFALELGFDALYGTRHNDGLWYHIPRMMFWLQQQGFAAWTTPVWQQIGLPVGADVVLGQNLLLGNGWRGIGYVTFLLSAGAIACVYLAALDFRLTRWQAGMTAILFGSFPGIGLRIWSVNSDMAAAFPVLAAYVVLHRMRDVKRGLALFMVLNGLAIACKPTVAPLALLLDGVALWQCKWKIAQLRSVALPLAALVLTATIVLSSFWPVYTVFSDFLGGDGGRGIKVASTTEFTHAVVMSTGHWLLEPLGYLTPVMEGRVKEAAKVVYNLLGARIVELPPSWKPWPAQDLGRTGLAAFLLLPALLIGLSPRARVPATLLFLIGFASSSGMIRYEAYNARYIVVLLAGYALLWGSARFFLRGKGRWVLAGLITLNACALLGVVSMRFYVDKTITSQPGGAYHYIAEEERKIIASTLAGFPLQVITNESLDALLVGPGIDFSLRYLSCPVDGDWERELRDAANTSNWLAIVHGGKKSILAGPVWHRPGFHACPEEVSMQRLEDALAGAGWQLFNRNHHVDVWQFPGAGFSSSVPPGNL
jgi:hypothetical protein